MKRLDCPRYAIFGADVFAQRRRADPHRAARESAAAGAGNPMIVLLLALQQQPAAAASAPPSPVARIAVSPASPTVTAGDTVRLSALALGSDG